MKKISIFLVFIIKFSFGQELDPSSLFYSNTDLKAYRVTNIDELVFTKNLREFEFEMPVLNCYDENTKRYLDCKPYVSKGNPQIPTLCNLGIDHPINEFLTKIYEIDKKDFNSYNDLIPLLETVFQQWSPNYSWSNIVILPVRKIKFDFVTGDDSRTIAKAHSPGEGDFRMIINIDKWEKLNPWERVWLFFHEYAHEVYNIQHGEIGLMYPLLPSEELVPLTMNYNPNERYTFFEGKYYGTGALGNLMIAYKKNKEDFFDGVMYTGYCYENLAWNFKIPTREITKRTGESLVDFRLREYKQNPRVTYLFNSEKTRIKYLPKSGKFIWDNLIEFMSYLTGTINPSKKVKTSDNIEVINDNYEHKLTLKSKKTYPYSIKRNWIVPKNYKDFWDNF
jgi:hypothetical protein